MPVLQPSPLLQALGWSLINSLWQMALLWVLYMLLSGGGRGYSARARHLLALVLTLAGSAWFVLSFLTRLMDPGLTDSRMVISLAVSPENDLFSIFHGTRQLVNRMVPYLSFAYLWTIAYLFARYLHYFRHMEHLKTSGLHKIQGDLRIFCSTTASQMGIRKKIAVWLSSAIDSPVTIGFLKPVILIPIATVTNLSTEQVESILLHELTHISRNDYLINLLLAIAGNVFFFNPFTRLLIAAIRKEREHCCDDLVLQFQYNPHTYASALLSLERSRHSHQHFAIGAVGRNDRLLLERVRRVTGHQARTNRFNGSLLACLLLAALMGILVFVQPRMVKAGGTTPSSVASQHPGEGPGMILTSFSSSIIPSPVASRKNSSRASKGNHHKSTDCPVIENDDQETELTLASNKEEDDQTDGAEVAPAVQTESRVYSITASPSTAPDEVPVPETSPYVPSSSFTYKVTMDTLPPTERFSYNELKAREAKEKVLEALNEIDWKEVEKQIRASNKNLTAEKLQELINSSLQQVDWQKINRDVHVTLSDADEKRINRDIKVQIEALSRVQARNTQQAIRLQTRINEEQLRLKRESLRKQVETMQKTQEQMKKKYKVVYI